MRKQRKFWLMGLALILTFALLTPGTGLAKGEGGDAYTARKEKLVKDLNLAPDKAKEFQAVDDKFHQSRKEFYERLKKNEDELEKVMAAPQPADAKIKELVSAISADHDKLMDTYKEQRRAEMALLTPAQQGKYLLLLKSWHKEMWKKEKGKEKQ